MMRVIKTFSRDVYATGIACQPVKQVHKAVVYYHATWGEYFVRFYVNGIPLHMATRTAMSEEDAMATADFWVNRGE